jgi:uncharacterized protein YkwD
VPPTRNLLATALTILGCACLGAPAPLAAADSATTTARASTHGHRAPRSSRPRHARAACAARASHSRPRARKAAHSCHASSHKTSPSHRAQPRPAPAPTTTDATFAPNATTSIAGHALAQEASARIAAVLATPCQNTELTPEAGNLGLVRAAVLCLINRERAENGKSPLTPSPQLEQAAEGHCAELVSDDYFAHVSPSGETPVDRIRATGYIPGPSVGYVIGENLAWGTFVLATPQAMVAAWIASPEHLANILEGQYRETGIGVTPAVPSSLAEGEPGATYAQEFGVIVQ